MSIVYFDSAQLIGTVIYHPNTAMSPVEFYVDNPFGI